MAKLNGFIALHRSLLEWEWYGDPNTVAVFIYLLLQARFTDGQWRGRNIKAGQVITGRDAIAQATGVSPRSVRTALQRLKATGTVTIVPTCHFSLITFVNWDFYQSVRQDSTSKTTSETTINRPANDQPATSQRPQRNQETTEEGNQGKKRERSATRFTPPTVEEVSAYCRERNNRIDPQHFVDFYTARGWKAGNSAMRDWKAAVRTWEAREKADAQPKAAIQYTQIDKNPF